MSNLIRRRSEKKGSKKKASQTDDDNESAPMKRRTLLNSQISMLDDPGTPTEEVIGALSKGSYLFKVRSFDKFYHRKFYVDLEHMRLHYTPSNKIYFFKDVPYIDLSDLQEVRKGWNTDRFNVIHSRFQRRLHASIGPKDLPNLKEENCFSLIFESSTETLDLIAVDQVVRDLWVKGLTYLSAICKNYQKENEYEYWLKEQFKAADVNQKGNLNFQEVLALLNQLNISMNKKHAKALFDAANIRKRRLHREEALDGDEFLKFYHMLLSRPELDILFKKYSINNASIMGPEELLNFLKKEQKMTRITKADCEAYIKRYEPEECQIPGYLSIKGFSKLMMSIDFNVFNRSHRFVCEDMTHPLTHYYVASSHNTYLTGDQLIGDSSIEGYIKALIRGCRCLELDCWNGDDGEPIIFHGYTLTSKIHLKDVLEAIKNYAFKTSQYPVILSIENHLSVEQQKKMAGYMIEIFGDYLHRTPVSDSETEWPSPERLVRKILIKGKKLAIKNECWVQVDGVSSFGAVETNEEYFSESEEDQEQEQDEQYSSNQKTSKDSLKRSSLKSSIKSFESDNQIQSDFKFKKVKEKTAKEFSDLVNYCASKKFHSFDDSFKKWKFYEMVSFNEKKSESLADHHGNDYVKYNQLFLSRIYPKGTRTDSSNYNPIPHWNVGCQLVALNYQTWSKPMLFNEGLFSLNGRCGYVLKPEFLRKGHQYGYSSRSSVSNSPSNKPKRVKIVIISGQHIPKPEQALDGEIVDPYVKIKIYGHSADKNTFKTNYIRNNGFNPIWNETFEFLIRIPELAFIYFVVKDYSATGSNVTLGQYTLPFKGIMEGYRHINLYDESNQPIIPATLFVHISFIDIAAAWKPE